MNAPSCLYFLYSLYIPRGTHRVYTVFILPIFPPAPYIYIGAGKYRTYKTHPTHLRAVSGDNSGKYKTRIAVAIEPLTFEDTPRKHRTRYKLRTLRHTTIHGKTDKEEAIAGNVPKTPYKTFGAKTANEPSRTRGRRTSERGAAGGRPEWNGATPGRVKVLSAFRGGRPSAEVRRGFCVTFFWADARQCGPDRLTGGQISPNQTTYNPAPAGY